MAGSTSALAVGDGAPRVWPGAWPPVLDDASPGAVGDPSPRGGPALGERRREAIREIVCDMVIAAVSTPQPPAAERDGGRRG